MFLQNRIGKLSRKIGTGVLMVLMSVCSAVSGSAAKENPRICPKDKLIMIRESFIGQTISKYYVYDCMGNYLGSTLNGNYVQKNVDVVDDNVISVVCADDATYVYLLKEHMKCLKLDADYNYVRPEGDLLVGTEYEEDTEKTHVLTRNGKEIFLLPREEGVTGYPSTTLKRVKYLEHGKNMPYYMAGSTNWDGFHELYLIDEEGTIIEEFTDSVFISSALFSESSYLDGKWYVCGWDTCQIFDAHGGYLDSCSAEEFNEMIGKEEEIDSRAYPAEGEEVVIGKSKKAILVRGVKDDEVYQRLERKDGTVLEESNGYENSYVLKNKYYICNNTEFGVEDDYSTRINTAKVYDYDGNVLKEYKNTILGDWPTEKYMTMEHGNYRGVIDMDGNWVLKQICTDGTD